jgi:hypothetical protein
LPSRYGGPGLRGATEADRVGLDGEQDFGTPLQDPAMRQRQACKVAPGGTRGHA